MSDKSAVIAPRRGRPSAFRPKEGEVYRTADLGAFTRNPTRLAKRMVDQGLLVQLAGGLYGAPRQSAFGTMRPPTEDVLKAFLNGTPYLRTGPEFWNALNLGATAVFATDLVYNTRRTGEIELGGQRYMFKRKAFPQDPTPEWYAIDLLENRKMAGISWELLRRGLAGALTQRRLNPAQLQRTAARWGGIATKRLVAQAIKDVGTTAGETAAS